MKQKPIFLFSLFSAIGLLGAEALQAQGCVAIRHFSTAVGNTMENNYLGAGDIQFGSNYRYFKSFRHFKGTEEEPDRVANGSEVINHSHSWDFFLTVGLSNRIYGSITIPTVINTRSSLYEHGREERHQSFSRGLADVRVGAGYWLFDPVRHENGNLALGLGIKLPTGNFKATDVFYNVGPEGSPEARPVDQSIQPGDGGFGITLDFQFYQKMADKLFAYGSGFYLINPRETNGVRTFRETLSPLLANEAITAVPDQFALRAGASYALSDLISTSLGARYEGVPVKDVIGGNDGFRRPGTVLSIDPGLAFMKNNFSFNLNVPFAVRRERPQSYTDKEMEELSGEPRSGDAAFADYLINVGISYRIGSKKVKVDPELMKEFN